MSKKKICFAFVFFIFVFFFKIVSAEVVISEIAWMGTSNSQYEEWIELKNNSSEDVNLSGWKLYKSGDQVLFSLSGTILANEYYLVCRTTGSITNPLSGICNEQGSFGGSGLNNTSDSLKLKDLSNLERDFVDASSGWEAGDSATKQTMQKSGNIWITATPTPKAQNQENNNSDDSDGNDNDDNNNDGSGGGSSSGGSTSSSSGSSSSSSKPKVKIIPTYKSKLLVPSLAFAGQQVEFNLEVKYGDEIFACGKYFWNFGDGDSKQYEGGFKKFTHTYYYPGEYNVSLEYFKNNGAFEPSIVDEMTIKVVPMTVSISNVGDYQDFFIEISNDADSKINISNWILSSDYKNFVLPKNTVIAKNSSVVISGKISGFTVADKSSLKLSMPTGEVVFDYNSKSVPVKRVAESSYNNFSENENTENSEYNSDSKNSNSNSKKDLASAPILSGQGSVLSKYGFVIGLFAFLLVGGALVYFVRRKNTSVTVSDQFDVIDE